MKKTQKKFMASKSKFSSPWKGKNEHKKYK